MLSKNPTRNKIEELQQSMLGLRCDMPEAKHYFMRKCYAREFTLPAGMLVVGKEHKHEHLLIVTEGHAEIVSEFGRDQVRGGEHFISPAGVKRVVLAFEDTTFITFHHNPEQIEDPVEIENVIACSDGFLPEYRESIERHLT